MHMLPWPNLFIVGAQKSGTSSIHEYLNQHPQIFMSPLKEPGYFHGNVSKYTEPRVIRNEEIYLNQFKKVKNEIFIGESTSYLQDPDSPKLIAEKIADCKIIIVLRDPIQRLFSHYFHHVRSGIEKRSFSEMIREDSYTDYDLNCKYNEKNRDIPNIVQRGFYSNQISRYYDTFDKKNVKIFIYEEFQRNYKKLIEEILKFLGLDLNFNFDEITYNTFQVPKDGFEKSIFFNKTLRELGNRIFSPKTRSKLAKKIIYKKNPEKPNMIPEDRKFLENLYYNDVLRTQEILGKSLPWLDNFLNDEQY